MLCILYRLCILYPLYVQYLEEHSRWLFKQEGPAQGGSQLAYPEASSEGSEPPPLPRSRQEAIWGR